MRAGRAIAVPLAFLALAAPAPADALTVPELICQQSLGKEALRFVKLAHKEHRRCEDAKAAGQLCDEGRRTADIAEALEKLRRKLEGRCDGIVLEHLGFPANCADLDGAPFTVADLGSCLDASHRFRIVAAIATAYPGNPAPLDGAELKCQRAIGNAAGQLLAKRLRARQSCLNDQLSGRIAPDVDCRAEPGGAGTGHAKTDRRLLSASDRLVDLLARGCADAAIESLGFPGSCADPDGAPFTLANLEACIHHGHVVIAEEMLAVEYPG
jgi:hypothetical protein